MEIYLDFEKMYQQPGEDLSLQVRVIRAVNLPIEGISPNEKLVVQVGLLYAANGNPCNFTADSEVADNRMSKTLNKGSWFSQKKVKTVAVSRGVALSRHPIFEESI